MVNPHTIRFLRWSARGISLLFSAFFLMFFVGEGLPNILHGQGSDLLPFLPWFSLALIGSLLAFFRERTGATLMFVSAVAMAIYVRDWPMSLVFSLPYILPAILYWAASSAPLKPAPAR
jgi:hypothetical protein